MTTFDPSPTPRQLWRWRVGGWFLAGMWLLFLNIPVHTALQQPNLVRRAVGVGAIVLFGLFYVYIFDWARRCRIARRGVPIRRASLLLAALVGLGLLSVPGTGDASLATLVYVAAAAMLLLPIRAALVVAAFAAGTPMVVGRLVPGWEPGQTVTLSVLLASFAMFGVSRLTQRNGELLAAQQEIRRLAVAEERARTARDLHDILGHSLTIVAVKAELAGRLLELDPARAAGEIADVERLAREALADVRRTVGAYRGVTLATELAGARSALSAAGIEADLPTDLPVLTKEWDELFGWVVREGVTNVVRHSAARRCVVEVHPDRVEVRDDGQGSDQAAGAVGQSQVGVRQRGVGQAVAGHGLLGVRERADRLDAVVTVERASAEGGFLLRVAMPAGAR